MGCCQQLSRLASARSEDLKDDVLLHILTGRFKNLLAEASCSKTYGAAEVARDGAGGAAPLRYITARVPVVNLKLFELQQKMAF